MDDKWKEYKLGDVITLNYGKALKTENRVSGNIPVFSSAGLSGWHNQPLVNSPSIIVGRKGTIGKIYYYDNSFWCIDTAYYILPNEKKYNFKFIYYLLQTLGLEELNEDSAVPGLNRDTAYSQDILLPPLPEQKTIASVLSSLDDKIDLLYRQNATLEKMAETLFRQWFVEEAKEEWKIVLLDNLISITSGRSIKRETLIDNGQYPILGANGKIGTTNDYLYNDRLIYTGRVGTLGNIFRIEFEKVWLSDNTLIIKPNKYYNFIYFTLKASKLEEYNVGSTQPLIRQSDIKEIEVLLPSNSILEKFESVSDEIFNKIKANQQQISTLTTLRDALLPKLMSGDVKAET